MHHTLDFVTRRADAFFMGKSNIHEAALRLTKTLDALGIPYAIAGALAANIHGHVRTTEDVDVLMTREGLAAFKERWLGRGWVEKFAGSKGMRDAAANVTIDVLLAGESGDGQPKPLAFPDPAQVAVRSAAGFAVLPLRTLIELKIASGMTAAHRMQDLADVIQLIRRDHLREDFPVHDYVAERYRELWHLAQIEDPE